MSLLELARGPLLNVALIVFIVGVLWRLSALLLLKHRNDLTRARRTDTWWGGTRAVFSRMWPRQEFFPYVRLQTLMGYTFHIGLAITVFAFVPHITFIRDLLGLSWPGLPGNLIALAGAVTLLAMLVLLARRLTHPVLRLLSGFDDYFSWAVTAAPLITGLMAYAHIGPRYETMLAMHILSFDLLLIWFPFGKLMHALLWVPSRATEGVLFERKGVEA